jgi:hypothetical protein
MAYKMKLTVPFQGMPYIWNISAHVGVNTDKSKNMATDVELVQRLLIERYKVSPSKATRAAGIGSISSATGTMDNITAFEIYWAGAESQQLKDAEVISPAHGGRVVYGAGMWTIGYLNYKLFKHARQVWENLPALCASALRTELTTKTSP